MRHPLRRLLLTVLTATIAISALPGSAEAGSYTRQFCTTSPGEQDFGQPMPWEWHNETNWGLSNFCPRGFELELVNGLPATEIKKGTFSGRYTLGPFTQMESVSLKITGDDGSAAGITQGFRVCDSTGIVCGALKLPGAEERVVLRRGTSDFPLNPARFLVIEGECQRSPLCDYAGEAVFSELEIVSEDDAPPVIDPIADAGWRSDVPYHSGGIIDHGSGVHRVEAPGLLAEPWQSGCADIDWRVVFETCWADFSIPPIDPSVLVEGVNTFRITAHDAAGNSSWRDLVYRYDTVASPAPADLRIAGPETPWRQSRIVTLAWRNDGEAAESATQSGLRTARIDVDPVDYGWDPAPEERALDAGSITSLGLTLPGNGRWKVRLALVDRAGNESPSSEVTVQIDDTRPKAPLINAIPTINAEFAKAGLSVSWLTYLFGQAGICGHTRAINGSAAFQPSDDPADANPAPSPWQVSPTELAALPEGRQFVHLRSISCGGSVGPTAHEPFLIDRVAPSLEISNDSEWLAGDDRVTLSASEQGAATIRSGVERIVYALDVGIETAVAGASLNLVIPPGRHTLRARAFDRAGNASLSRTFDVGYDPRGPSVVLMRGGSGDPAALRADLADAHSGVVDAWIDLQSVHGGPWRRLGSRFRPAVPGLGPVSIDARIPDDGEFPDGDYRLRVVAYDAAGHATIATQWAGGDPATFSLPLRARPSLRLSSDGRPLDGLLLLGFDDRRHVGGVLSMPGGAGVSGVALAVFESRPGGVVRLVDQVTTGEAGRFRYSIAPDVSRRIDFRFTGNPTLGPATASVGVKTGASVSLRPDRRLLRGRGVTRLTGRVDLSRAALPAHPFMVTIESLLVRGKRYSVPVSSDGSFAWQFRFQAKTRPIRFRYRAVTPSYSDWPFAKARSKVVSVVVAP